MGIVQVLTKEGYEKAVEAKSDMDELTSLKTLNKI